MATIFTPVDAKTVHGWITGSGEIAFLDLQEIGQHGLGHPLVSSNLPFSRLEAEIRLRVPRTGTRIVLLDAGDGVSERAAERLAALGYTDLHVLAGGAPAWAAAGYALFDGTNVPSKGFAEVLEVALKTPHISAEELDRLRAEGADFVLLDNRTPEEFTNFHVPGARSAPGIELVARAEDYIPNPDTLVVVSCAGRTRSIIGAQGLINFGIPNRVVSLEGGTQGWRLAGLTLEHTPADSVPPLSAEARRVALARAAKLREAYGIGEITPSELDRSLAPEAGHTSFVFDIRTREDYLAGHHPAARWVPGGQLVQTLDQWASVLNARIVLIDDDGVRASIVAHWLSQLGWDVSVLTLSPADLSATGPSTLINEADLPEIADISAAQAREWLGAEGRIVHAGSSADFLDAHPEGAVWAIRPRLDALPDDVARAPRLLIVGDGDLATARLLAGDLARAGTQVRLLAGGTAAWAEAGLPVTEDPAALPDDKRLDVLFWLARRHQDDFDGMRAYLNWELELPGRIENDGTARFRIPAPVGP